ncbi:signal peptidase I [Sessilibacter sp. MAH4]
MDFINFPLILMVLVTVTGLLWLFDIIALAPKRKLQVAAVDDQFKSSNLEDENIKQQHSLAISAVKKEPVLIEYSKSFFPVLALVFVLRSFLYEPFQIPSESMVPTLEVGDFILVNKYTYGIRMPVFRNKLISINEPKRGDVMVFFKPGEQVYYIKRVIGLPGDKIAMKNNVLYVNGKRQALEFVETTSDEHFDYRVYEENLEGFAHKMRNISSGRIAFQDREWTVEEGHYFMMGDNRDNSSDSRVWGTVPAENIVGKAEYIWMHWESFGIPSFSNVGSIQ